MQNLNLRAGALSGLIAVTVTSIVNIACRFLGLLPDQLDMKFMAIVFINPLTNPIPAFWVGLLIHILSGVLAGAAFVVLIKQPTPLKGVAFSLVAVWLGMMLIVFPIAGFGIFGLSVSPLMALATFLLNILYGLIVGAVAQRARIAA
ncbi:MAG: DUF6789 family protein [Chloroflexota bacterium]